MSKKYKDYVRTIEIHWTLPEHRSNSSNACGVQSPADDDFGPAGPRRGQPPITAEPVKIKKPPKVAAGAPSILKAAEFTLKEPRLMGGVSVLARLNQFDEVDCPGCAWPDPDEHRSINEYCENGVKAISEEATTPECTPDFFRKGRVADLCHQSDYWLGHRGRLTRPMVLRAGSDHYEEIAWDDGFVMIARELNALQSPDQAIFYTSGRTLKSNTPTAKAMVVTIAPADC